MGAKNTITNEKREFDDVKGAAFTFLILSNGIDVFLYYQILKINPRIYITHHSEHNLDTTTIMSKKYRIPSHNTK